MKIIYAWGLKFHPLSKTEIVSLIQERLNQGQKGIHITGVNSEVVVKAQHSPFLSEAINDSDIVNIDNMFITVVFRLCGYSIPERAATPDVFEMLLQEGNKRNQSVYFLGAEPQVLNRMINNIQKQYPDLSIVGSHDGFYSNEMEIVDEIRRLAPTYLFIALPSPQKESFIMKYKRDLRAGVCYGVGGAFDVKGEKVKRAPAWLGKIGLEGTLRILQNPMNYGVRTLKYYPTFVKLAFFRILDRKNNESVNAGRE